MSVTALDSKKGGGADSAPAEEKKGKGKLIIIIVAVLVVAAAGYFYMSKSKGSAAPPKPEAGTVFPLDSIQVNLADGHFLKITIAVQGTKKAKELDGSKALDATISLFTGQTVTQLSDNAYRDKMKEELTKKLEKLYEDEVMGVYFTEFVMQ